MPSTQPENSRRLYNVIMHEQSAAVIVAAGNSRRMQGLDKLWLPLAGRITLARTIDVFEHSPHINHIVIVTNAERIQDIWSLRSQEDWHKVCTVVTGGITPSGLCSSRSGCSGRIRP